MALNAQDGKPAAGEPDMGPVLDVLTQMGRLTNEAVMYGMDHRVTATTLAEVYQHLEQFLRKHQRLSLSIVADQLHVNGHPADYGRPQIRAFGNRLAAINAPAFSVSHGMTLPELADLIRALVSPPSAGSDPFSQAVEGQKLPHIQPEKSVYRTIGEGETVIKTDRLKRVAQAQAKAAREAQAARQAQAQIARQAQAQAMQQAQEQRQKLENQGVREIVAFLQGDVGSVMTQRGEKAMQSMAQDPAQLGELIMKTAVVRQKAQPIQGGESLADIVVGCIRRACEGMTDETGAVVAPGQQVQKSLMLLEKTILDRLRDMAADVEVEMRVSNAVKDMIQNVEIDRTAAEYAAHRKALADAEQKLTEYLDTQGDTLDKAELIEKLAKPGMSPGGWRELVVSARDQDTGGGEGPGGGGGSASGKMQQELGVLAALLTELDTLMSAERPDTQTATERLASAHDHIERLADATKEKITALEEHVSKRATTSPIGGKTKGRELLAEIGQALCQPASVIQCALSIMEHGMDAGTREKHQEILNTLEEAVARLRELLHLFVDVVGVPDNYSDRLLVALERKRTRTQLLNDV